MTCPQCHNELYRIEGLSSEPDGIRLDAFCNHCFRVFYVSKAHTIERPNPRIAELEKLNSDLSDALYANDKRLSARVRELEKENRKLRLRVLDWENMRPKEEPKP